MVFLTQCHFKQMYIAGNPASMKAINPKVQLNSHKNNPRVLSKANYEIIKDSVQKKFSLTDFTNKHMKQYILYWTCNIY